jgi:hypothetical protein
MKRKLSDMGFMPIVSMHVRPIKDQFGKKGGILFTPIVMAEEVTRTEINMTTGETITETSGPMKVPMPMLSFIYTLN